MKLHTLKCVITQVDRHSKGSYLTVKKQLKPQVKDQKKSYKLLRNTILKEFLFGVQFF